MNWGILGEAWKCRQGTEFADLGIPKPRSLDFIPQRVGVTEGFLSSCFRKTSLGAECILDGTRKRPETGRSVKKLLTKIQASENKDRLNWIFICSLTCVWAQIIVLLNKDVCYLT